MRRDARPFMLGDRFGTHRVLHPAGALPQPAWKLDNDVTRRYETEIFVEAETLNIDAASFRQMQEAAPDDGVARLIEQTVRERGKQHNPVTGSGGMLLGRISWVGSAARDRGVTVGERVATLASLSLTPLALRRVVAIRPASAQVDVEATAIVFHSAPLAKIPADLPERLSLAVLDVAGAAPQAARLVGPGARVVVLGAGGKSGLLVSAEARRCAGPRGTVVGIEANPRYADELGALGYCDRVVRADARQAAATREAVLEALQGAEADVTFSCVDVGGVELTAALLTRARGKVYYFAMSTSFSAAALGAEGIGKDVDLFIGNGYAEGHAGHTLDLVRSSPALLALLERRYT